MFNSPVNGYKIAIPAMTSRTPRTLHTALCVLIVALSSLLLYGHSLGHGFVYDDLVLVQNNPGMARPANALKLLSPEYFHISGERTFRPLNTLTYIADSALWNGRARGFHLTNMLLHAACAVLLFLLFHKITGAMSAGLLGALLFAAHPLNTEAVCAVTFREDIIACGFTAAGLLVYAAWFDALRGGARPGPWTRLAPPALGLLFLMGLAGKESALTLAPAVLLYDWALAPGDALGVRARRLAAPALALAVAGAAFFAAYFYLSRFSGGAPADFPTGSAAGAAPVMFGALTRYVYLFLAPFRLCADYSQIYVQSWDAAAVFGAALLTGLGILGIVARRVLPGASFGLLFFVAALAPVSNIVPFGAVFAERYTYMPNAGLCLALASLFLERPRGCAAGQNLARPRTAYAVLLAVLCGLFCFLTVQRVQVWRSGLSLWGDTVACCPDCARAHVNYGRELLDHRAPEQARTTLQTAVHLDPHNFQAFLALGRAEAETGRDEMAIVAYRAAIALEPDVKYSYYNLALVYIDKGEYREAIRRLIQALRLDPHYLEARLALANALFRKGILNPPEVEMLRHNLGFIREALPSNDPRRRLAEQNFRILEQALDQ